MWRYLVLAGSMIITAVGAPTLFDKVMDAREMSPKQTEQVALLSGKGNDVKATDSATLSGRKVKIKAGYGGHYSAEVRMNNRPVKVLVDTGATMVAINETTARKIGIRLKKSDFKHKINTANGTAFMATATISQIQIGNIRVHNVRAAIAKDEALSGSLLGMSFLKQLKRFEVSGDQLVLEQ